MYISIRAFGVVGDASLICMVKHREEVPFDPPIPSSASGYRIYSALRAFLQLVRLLTTYISLPLNATRGLPEPCSAFRVHNVAYDYIGGFQLS